MINIFPMFRNEGRKLDEAINAPTLPIPLAHWSMEPVAAISPENRTTIYGYGENNSGTKQTNKSVYEGPDYTGNLGDLLEQHAYEYDPAGRMTQVEIDSDGDEIADETTTYQYNDNNLRVGETVDDGSTQTTTRYQWDTNNFTGYAQVLEEYVNDVLFRTYTLGYDVISQHDVTNGVLTLLYDAQGSTRALLDTSGLIVQQLAYNALGRLLSGAGLTATGVKTNLQHQGEWHTPAGLKYLRVRWEEYLRFLTTDPRWGTPGHPISNHRYLAFDANSQMNSDPSGLITLTEISTAAQSLAMRVAMRAGPAFAVGGVVLGRFINAVGLHTQRLVQQTLSLFPRLSVESAVRIQNSVIDYVLRSGNAVAQLEVKYSLPSRTGDAFNRLIRQVYAMNSVGGQTIVFSLRQPAPEALNRLLTTLGTQQFSQVQFVYGIDGLFHVIKLYFGF